MTDVGKSEIKHTLTLIILVVRLIIWALQMNRLQMSVSCKFHQGAQALKQETELSCLGLGKANRLGGRVK